MFKKLIVTICLLLISPGISLAQSGYTLEQLEEMVWGGNQSVEAAYQRLKAALYEQEEANLFPSPRFGTGMIYCPSGHTASQVVLQTTTAGNVNLSYPALSGWLERHYNVREKEAKSQAMEGELSVAKNEVLFALRQKYFQAQSAQQLVQIYNKASFALKEVLQEVQRLYQQKQLLLSDVLLAEKRLLQMRAHMSRQQDNYLEQKSALALLLGMDEELLLLTQQSDFSLPSVPKLSDLIELAYQNNPALMVLEARQRAEYSNAQKGRWEGINLQLVSGYYNIDQQRQSGYEGGYVGFNLSVPLNLFTVASLRNDQALSRKRAVDYDISFAKSQLKNSLRQTYRQFSALEIEYQVISKQKEEAKARLSQLMRYKQYSLALEIDYQQLIHAQSDYWDAEARMSEKEFERSIVFYKMLYLTGFNQTLPANFLPSSASVPAFPVSKVCMRSVVVEDPSFLSSAAEVEFFVFFCQTKGIGRVFLPLSGLAEEERLAEMLTQLSQNKIDAYLYLDENNPQGAVASIISFNERHWQANWQGIYLVGGELAALEQVKKTLSDSGQDFRIILQVSINKEWRELVNIADELAFSDTEWNLPAELESMLKAGNKPYWRVFGLKDNTFENEQSLEAKIQGLRENNLSMGVVLDDYTLYRQLITR